ncbi:MAG: 2-dehydropantoate 2-reductase [Pseudomonadota bacterium]
MNFDSKIAVAGAGSIGCFVGGLLKAAGRNVVFLGRKRIADELYGHGLHLTDYSGMDLNVPNTDIEISEDPDLLSQANVILVCVKSGATETIANLIKTQAPASAIVVSLQNGVRNADALRNILPKFDVRAGMVPFNVVQMGSGRFHRGTSGTMVVEAGEPDIGTLLNVPHLKTQASSDMQSVLWGKLMVNLNNALNALSDVPLVEELKDRNWRLKLADQMTEAIAVMKTEGISPKPPSPVPAWVIPHILRLPTPLFHAAAKQMLAIDPQARSSMWEDIQQGRRTEIDELQGEIIRLGEKHGIATPVNQQTFELIRKLEGGGEKS